MKLHALTSIHPKGKKRIGRGGKRGTYSGKGMKGQLSRSGGGKGAAFEGGQTPLIRRMPKLRGFTPLDKITYQPVNVGELDAHFEDGAITKAMLKKASLISSTLKHVKLLGNGEVKKAFTIEVDASSKSAVEKIESAKGKVEIVKHA